MTKLSCYRVWMKDGYAGLYNAESESDARRQATEWAIASLQEKNCDYRSYDRDHGRGAWKKATTVERVEKLS